MSPQVSVLLLSYDRPLGLRRAVDSVLSQAAVDLELIVLDDASTDPDVQVACAEARRDSRVRVHVGAAATPEQKRDEVCTAGRLLNLGMALARYGFVAYLSDGAEFTPGRLRWMLDHMDAHPACDLVWGKQDVVWYDAHGDVRRRRTSPEDPAKHEIWKSHALAHRLAGGNCVDLSSALERRTDRSVAWSEDPAHWVDMDLVRWRAMAALDARFDHRALRSDVKHSLPSNMGRMIKTGRTIADVARRRV